MSLGTSTCRNDERQLKGTRIMSIGAVDTSSVAAIGQAYRLTACTGASQGESTGQTGTTAEDYFTLSSEGEKVLHLSSLFGTEPGKPITLDDIQAFAEKQLESFNQHFKALLRENGIDTSQPITLGHEYGTGRVIVTNDHPQADEIEALLKKDLDLCNTYIGGTNALELIRHGQEHSKFAQAYAENPQMAVTQFSYLFNSRWEAAVSFSDGGYGVAYQRVSRQ
jgi:hypothetical protein